MTTSLFCLMITPNHSMFLSCDTRFLAVSFTPSCFLVGPGITISFIIGAISAILTALSYSEFAARVPVTGSAYSYGYASFGELLAWM